MASRKEQKEAAREARLAAEQAAAAKTAQTRRMGMIAGVIVVAVIVVVVAIVVSTSSSKSGSSIPKTKAQASADYKAVAAELAGIPQTGTVLGKASAPVTIQYFGDLECPICKEFTLGEGGGGLPQLIAGPVKSGAVKLDYKSFETASGAVNSDRFGPQQIAAEAAGTQHLFWDYAELFYHEQGSEDDRYVTESYLTGLAQQIPSLNLAAWQAARNDASLKTEVATDATTATKDGLQGTPTLVAIGPKTEEIVPAASGIPTFSEIQSAIKAVS